MKDFDDFLKTLPKTDVAKNVEEKVRETMAKSTDNKDAIAGLIVTTSYQLTINLLAEYHKWLHQQT